MSPGHRQTGGKNGKGEKSSWRRRKDEVSIADRLNQPTHPGQDAPPPGSILPGQDQGRTPPPPKKEPSNAPPKRDERDQRAHKERPGKQPQRAPGTVLPGKGDAAAVPAQTRKQLRQQREEQKRQERQRWGLTGLAVLAVVVVGILVVVWISGRDSGEPAASGTGRTEQTLAMTLAGENSSATSGALMINDAANSSAASVLVPSRLFVEGPTPNGIPVGDTVLLGDDAAPGNALADTLDVIVDNTWQMSDSMLETLVDKVDGVLVDVDVDVVDGRTIVVAAGDGQLLNGKQAVAYANYLAKGDVEEARLARFGDVLDQLMQRLPNNRDTLVKLFTEVNATERSTLSVDDLADFALEYGNVARGGDAAYQSLPTTVLESSGKLPALNIDPEGLDRLRSGLLADSLPPDAGGDQITVLIQNGVGTPGIEQDAATLLRDAGYDFLNGGNANSFGVKQTIVLIPDSTTASVTLGEDVASTLGVPDSAVEVSDQGSSVADVIVVLGEDFKP
jgi:hypothetical protein